MIEYIVKQFLVSGILLCLYYWAYSKRDQFHFNRIFILVTLLFSAVVPLISINAFPTYHTLSAPAPVRVGSTIVETYTSFWSFGLVYFSIALVLVLVMIFRYISTYYLMRRNHQLSQEGKYSGSPMSFFNFIAVPDADDSIVLAHEQYHVMAGHSFDRLLMSLIQAVLWANPLLFLYKRFLVENHELAADEYSIKANKVNTLSYSEHLVKITEQNIYAANSALIINHFYSLSLKRIHMLDSKKSSSVVLKCLSLIAFIGLFCSMTLKSYTVTNFSEAPEAIFTDTLPDAKNLTFMDTTSVYNFHTNEKSIVILKSSSEDLEYYLNNIDYSGELINSVDTVSIVDYETYEETVTIFKREYPVEIVDLLKITNFADREHVIESAMKAMKK